MLKILKRIVQEVSTAPHLSEALSILVHSVRKAIEADAVSIYLIDQKRAEYVLVAVEGLDKQAPFKVRLPLDVGLVGLVGRREEPINLAHAKTHAEYSLHPLLNDQNLCGFLGVPLIQHRRLYGVLCVQQSAAKHFDDAQEAFLITLAAQLGGIVAQAEISGELSDLTAPATELKQKMTASQTILSGLGCVPGIGIGVGVVVYPLADLDMVPKQTTPAIENEIHLFLNALQTAREEIQRLANKMKINVKEEELALFDVYLKILDNENLGAEVVALIQEDEWCAETALSLVIKQHVQQFENMEDEYLRERASDFKDLGRRVLAELQRSIREEFVYPEHTILIGEEISANDLAEVPEGQLAGIVSLGGANNSHVAILARALSIPSVMGVKGLKVEHLSKRMIIVDGYEGQIYVDPNKKLLAQFKKLAEEEKILNQHLMALKDTPAITKDGHRVALQVNIGLALDTGLSLNVGAEGVGLYRSEVPFMSRDRFPSEDEQYTIYRQILSAFSPRSVTMRTLDIGGDKILSYFPMEEENPYLGWRGIRVTLDHPDVFLMQVRAMMRASEGLNNLRMMLPMVTTLGEVQESLHLIHQAHTELLEENYQIERPKVGVMIEIPAACALIKDLSDWIDFISVGSNDLTQYLLAVDRNNARVASLYDPFHPAMLKTLMQIAEDCHAVDLEASICGEMASDPLAVILLVAMGYDVLSMNASSLPKMKWVIQNITLKEAKKILYEVLSLRQMGEIRLHLEQTFEKQGLTELMRMGRATV